MNIAISQWELRRTTCFHLPTGLDGERTPLFSWAVRAGRWEFECGGVAGVIQPVVEGAGIWFESGGQKRAWRVERGERVVDFIRYHLFDEERNVLSEMKAISRLNVSEWEPKHAARVTQYKDGAMDLFVPDTSESFRSIFRKGGLVLCGELQFNSTANLFPLFLNSLAYFQIWEPHVT
jgi:hypothetical protein